MSAAKATGVEWRDPSLGPKEGKTHQAMLDRREAIERHVAAGGEQPRNVDPIEARHVREQTEKRRAFVPKCLSETTRRVREQQRGLAGTSEGMAAAIEAALADETLPAGRAPLVGSASTSDETPLTVDEIARRGRIGEALNIFGALSDDDQQVWLRMLRDGGDFEALTSRCVALKNELAGPAINPDGSLPANPMTPTPREHTALAGLLSASKAYRRILLPHPKACECKSCKAAT